MEQTIRNLGLIHCCALPRGAARQKPIVDRIVGFGSASGTAGWPAGELAHNPERVGVIPHGEAWEGCDKLPGFPAQTQQTPATSLTSNIHHFFGRSSIKSFLFVDSELWSAPM
jgi:hypothetical protein